jgi:hypothetical protein
MQQEKAVGSIRTWEVVVAAIFLAIGGLVVYDSRRLGAEWASDGPQAGYFPFFIGVLICIAAAMSLWSALSKPDRAPFVTWGQLKMVLIVMVPYAVYVTLIANPIYSFGFYEASVIFIAIFMRRLGKYGWGKTAMVSIGTMVAFFLMFEIWFSVPLPKGPIEVLLGFA